MIQSKAVSICNHSHARRANSSKITILGGYPSLMPLIQWNLLTQWHEICSQKKLETTLSSGRNPESLSRLGLNRYRAVTDGWTDRITIASMRLAPHA